MKIKEFNPGDKVEIATKYKKWVGRILESSDSEIILLKLDTGYNIGLRESDILNAKTLEKLTHLKKGEPITPHKKGLKNIAMIITGGTISSRLDPKTGGTIPTDAEEILHIAPELKDICNVKTVESPFLKFSEDMDPSDWKKIAELSAELLNQKDIDGIIITHGTDTLSYTGTALSFFLKDLNKPVALTYSQRSIDRGSTDAHLNLVCAARYAISDIAEVAIVGHEDENDEFCVAILSTKARKMHTSRRDAFRAINTEPLARISKDSLEILREFNAKDLDKKVKLDAAYNDKVALVQVCPGADPAILEYYSKEKYKGIVIATTGLGHVPGKGSKYNWLPKIKKAVDSGMTIVAVPGTIYGRLNPNVYSSGRDLQKTGIIHLQDMLPETALVKLGWILGHKSWAKDKEKVREKLLENLSGEFNDRLLG
jgi:glutamyl-tRNA(Gln) amidotransferase subunit D